MKHRPWAPSLGGVASACIAAGCGGSSGASSGADAGAVTSASNAMCQATIAQGALSGKLAGKTCEYLGIRYGAPPIHELRFAPPKPAAGWHGVLDATKFGDACIQASSLGMAANGGLASSEDCLFVNVYAPRAAPAHPLPVMVFIHGGAFTLGAGSQYDARSLAEAGPVVTVTLNYRLGALGYLALPALDAQRSGAPSGSDGIRDQQLALQWVKDNISVFYGDPGNVTAFGESAGSMSTCIHIVSPGSQGLAKNYILESGACVGPATLVGTKTDRYTLSGQLAAAMCPNASGTGALDCLRAADGTRIMTWVPTATPMPGTLGALLGNSLGAPFYPIVEGPGGVLPDLPANLILKGTFSKDGAIIAGTNAHEFGLFAVTLPMLSSVLGMSGSPAMTVTTVAQLDQGIQQVYGSRAAEVEAQYPATDATAQDVYIQLVTDYAFRCPTRDLARLTTAHGTKSLYLYSYEYGRAYHSDELPNLFTVTGLGSLGAMTTMNLANDMKGYWTRLAIAGDPNGTGAAMWPAYAQATDQHLVLDDPGLQAGAHLDQSNCDFWDKYSGFQTQ